MLSGLLKPNDVARLLAVSRAWVYEAARSGRIPSVRVGGGDGPLRFVPDDIEEWLEEARAQWTPGGARRSRRVQPAGGRRAKPRPRRSGGTAADQQSLL